MDPYLLIAGAVILLWLIGFGIYLVISNRQRGLEGELNHLNDMLEDDGSE